MYNVRDVFKKEKNMKEFITVLRKPDNVIGATEASSFRFEENPFADCPVKYDYVVGEKSAKVIVYPSGSPVKYLKLRFRGDFSFIEKVFGDAWGRSSCWEPLEWTSVRCDRSLPWFTYVIGDDRMKCYGVKTSPDAFVMWQVDNFGITLFLNLTCAQRGTDLKEPLLACEVVELESGVGEDPYKVAKKFAKLMCQNGVQPKTPVFGVNNWYWAYGNINYDIVSDECDYLKEMTAGCKNEPYLVIDSGWTVNRLLDDGKYLGGPWTHDKTRFPGGMVEIADTIHSKGAKAGLWYRPMITTDELPDEAVIYKNGSGNVMDPSHPLVLERLERDAALMTKTYGFNLLKHDFSREDTTGGPGGEYPAEIVKLKIKYFDNTKTTATITKNLYKAIQKGAGDAEVIGCDVFGHLSAGIHSMQRIGGDTSGNCWEWTRADGINSMMRLPTNDIFYNADPDCPAFTKTVDYDLNMDFLEVCALTGMTALASVTPHTLSDAQMKRINEIYRLADKGESKYEIKHFDKVSIPYTFASPDGKDEKIFNWQRKHDGVRSVFHWIETPDEN